MVKYAYLLSKDDIELAKAEVVGICKGKSNRLYDDLLVVDSKESYSERLAYAHKVFRFLFSAKNIEKGMQTFDWSKIYRKDFCLRTHGFRGERELAKIIFKKLKKPKVKLKDSSTQIEIFKKGKDYLCCLFVAEVEKSFLKRSSHLRPKGHPTSTCPRLTRACINMLGVGKKDSLLDPFCGGGTTLIEAGLMGLHATGDDIDERLVKKAKENIRYYKTKAKVMKRDCRRFDKKYDYVVTDLPYGKGTKNIIHKELYKAFMEESYKKVKKGMVVMFPDFVDYRGLLSGWKVKKRFSFYLHKSLSKRILVLEKT